MTPQNPTTPRLTALMADAVTVADLRQGRVDRTGSASPLRNDMLSLLEGGEQALEQAQAALKFTASQADSGSCYAQNEVRLLVPVPRPRSIRDCIIVEQVGKGGALRWNFHKYLLDGEGGLVDMWPAALDPLATEVTETIEGLL